MRAVKSPIASLLRRSGQLRAFAMLVRASPMLAAGGVVFVLAEGALPNLVIVLMGHATGRIPAAVRDGLGSGAGHALIDALALAGAVYALSLLRGPVECALSAAARARMAVVLQTRLVTAVCAPAGVAHLEDPATGDRLAGATGEIRGDLLADAPMTVISQAGSRLAGALSCVVFASFRWWAGLLLLVVWLAVRRPSRAFVVSRVTTFRRATSALRQAQYLLALVAGGPAAKEVRVFGLRDWTLRRHRDRWLAAMRPSWGELHAIEWRIARIALVVLAANLVCAGELAGAAFHGHADLRTLATMLPMLPMSMQLGSVSVTDVQLTAMLAGLPDLDALESALAADGPGVGDEPDAALPARELRLEGVSFRYPGTERDVLRGVDLTLAAGRSLALVGLNGAGKTTLVALLARLYEPTAGTISADGVALARLRAAAWQRRIALLSQEAMRLPLTARENVTLDLADEPADAEALDDAARRAGAADVIARLPDGWETVLSPRYAGGVDLSGGEWQRLTLARALLAVRRGARVLVLDEPTAQLDVRGEAAFYERFLDLTADTTSLIISHRFSTVRRAERIAVLDGGRITELGSHDELMAARGEYARMFTLQAEPFGAAR